MSPEYPIASVQSHSNDDPRIEQVPLLRQGSGVQGANAQGFKGYRVTG